MIEQKLLAHGDHRSWPTIKKELETHRSTTIRLPDAAGGVHHLRVATTANAEQKKIYGILELNGRPLHVKHLLFSFNDGPDAQPNSNRRQGPPQNMFDIL